MKKFIFIVTPAILLFLTILILNKNLDKNLSDSILWKNDVFVLKNCPYWEEKTGDELLNVCKDYIVSYTKNTVTNIGKNNTRDALMSGTGRGAWNVLQLSQSSSSPTAADTSCASPINSNGIVISTGTTAVENGYIGNFSVTKTWTATGDVTNIYKVCLGNTTSSGMTNTLMASALLPNTPINLGNQDNITVIYYIAVT